MKILRRNIGLLIAILNCAMWLAHGTEVKVFPGINVDINEYKTFEWLAPRVVTKVGVVEDHPANPVLKEAVGRQLVQRGLSEVASDADLQIQAYVLTESVPQLEAFIMGSLVYQPGDYAMVGASMVTVGRYNKMGTLYVNLIDRRAKKSAWFGMATEGLPNGTMKPEEVRSKLEKAASAMFKKYPIKKK